MSSLGHSSDIFSIMCSLFLSRIPFHKAKGSSCEMQFQHSCYSPCGKTLHTVKGRRWVFWLRLWQIPHSTYREERRRKGRGGGARRGRERRGEVGREGEERRGGERWEEENSSLLQEKDILFPADVRFPDFCASWHISSYLMLQGNLTLTSKTHFNYIFHYACKHVRFLNYQRALSTLTNIIAEQ